MILSLDPASFPLMSVLSFIAQQYLLFISDRPSIVLPGLIVTDSLGPRYRLWLRCCQRSADPSFTRYSTSALDFFTHPTKCRHCKQNPLQPPFGPKSLTQMFTSEHLSAFSRSLPLLLKQVRWFLNPTMALPVVKTLADCVDFQKTVLPYSSQFYDLPQQTIQNISNLQGLKVLYVSTNPLVTAFAFSLLLFPIFLVTSEINKNYSQVDRFWSILPTVYNAHYAFYTHAVGLPTERLAALLAVSTVWSVSGLLNSW